MRRTATFLLAATLSLTLFGPFAQAAPVAQTDPPIDPPYTEVTPSNGSRPEGDATASGTVAAMIQLNQPPATESEGRDQIDAAQQQLLPAIEALGAQVLFRTQLVYNGIAVTAPAEQIPQLRALPDVADVHLMTPKAQATAEIPALISSSLTDMAPSSDGSGVRVAVIDTGIDYTHGDFGGAGTPSAYQSNNPSVVEPGSFPTAKVVDGYDFAGDAYNAAGTASSTIPSPDPDPLDCNGRGTHIAGLVAGQGVNAIGGTYGGPYNSSVNYSDFKIAPGVAPNASLYALKVFGCGENATTTLTAQALEWAIDPNRDGDTSDHLDVAIIGSSTPFGSPDDPDAQAVARAIQAGMVVVTAAGDGIGSFYSVQSYGTANGAIAVGASIGSPQRLSQGDDEQYTDPACFDLGSLSAQFVGNNMAVLRNQTPACTFEVGLASYRKFDEVIDHQELYDSDTAEIGPGKTVTLKVDVPDCATQVDVFRGPVLHSLNGRRYSTRLIQAQHVGGSQYCAASEAASYGLPSTTTRGIQRGNATLKPDMVAPSINISSAAMGSGTGSSKASASWAGAAQVAGAAALLRGLHPTWGPAEVKAALMNTATPVLMDNGTPYPTSLEGAGQLNLARLASADLFAYSSADGDAAISFGAPVVSQPWVETRTIAVANTGTSDKVLTTTLQLAAQENGVSISLPSTVSIPAGGTTAVSVSISIDPSLLDFTPDLATTTVLTTTGSTLKRPRFYVAEHSGFIQLGGGTEAIRVPFVVIPRAGSETTVSSRSLTVPYGATSFSLPQTNTGARNATMNITNNRGMALTSAFQLVGTSPANPSLTGTQQAADLRYLGVTSDSLLWGEPNILFFGIATEGPRSTLNEMQFRIYIDSNLDDVADYVLINTTWPDSQSQPTDAFRFSFYKINADGSIGNVVGEGQVNAAAAPNDSPYVDTAPFNSAVIIAPVGMATLNVPSGQSTINVRVETRLRAVAGFTAIVDQLPESGWSSYDVQAPAIAPMSMLKLSGRPLFIDTPSSTISGTVNTTALAASGGAQMLVMHMHNAPGSQVEIVNVRTATPGNDQEYRIYFPTILVR